MFYDVTEVSSNQPIFTAYQNLYGKFPKDSSVDVTAEIYIGLDSLDKNGSTGWDSEELGEPVMAMIFNGFEEPSHQTHLKLMCDDLRSAEYVIPDSINCWIDDFQVWFKQEGEKLGQDFSLPF